MDEKKEVFICYAHEDELLRQSLETHLRVLQLQNFISVWHDRKISPGADWRKEINNALNRAHIILLLISPDFMALDYCYGIEMKRALQRHEQGAARVLPIILRPVHWQTTSLGKLQALPTDAKPVISSSWYSQDEAFYNIAEGIRTLIKEDWISKGWALYELKYYEEAITAFDQVIRLGSSNAEASEGKAKAVAAARAERIARQHEWHV